MNILAIIAAQPLSGEPLPAVEWDSLSSILLKIAAVIGLVLLNGFFVAAEFAIVKVRASQLDALAGEEKGKAAKLRITNAQQVVEHLDSYLSATQLGITLASLGLGWVGEPFLARVIEPLFTVFGVHSAKVIESVSFALAFSTITILHIVLGELAPKSLAIRKPLPTTLLVSAPLRIFRLVFAPAIWTLNSLANIVLRYIFKVDPVAETEMGHSEEELRVILGESEKSREVTAVGKELLINTLDLRRRVVRDIMTPRGEVVYLDIDTPFEENLAEARASRHTRFPLCKGYIDNPIGLVHIKDLLELMRQEKPDLLSIKRDALLVPEMMPLERLLTTFLTKHAHLGMVVDEFGGTMGIVTLDNVLAEIVGDIRDEFDAEQTELKQLNYNEFEVEGILGLYELNDLTDLELSNAEVSTVGGYVTHLLGHLPEQDEQLEIGDYLVTVTETDGRRINKLHFKRLTRSAVPEESAAQVDAA